MNKLDRLAIAAKTRATMLKDSLTSKKLGDSQVVVALVLIVVAVGLAIIFRNQVNIIIANVASRVQEAVNDLAKGVVDNTAGTVTH
jgi:hypothetical protein